MKPRNLCPRCAAELSGPQLVCGPCLRRTAELVAAWESASHVTGRREKLKPPRVGLARHWPAVDRRQGPA